MCLIKLQKKNFLILEYIYVVFHRVLEYELNKTVIEQKHICKQNTQHISIKH